MSKSSEKTFKYDEIRGEGNDLLPCPICEGELHRKVSGGIPPKVDDITCQSCGTKFREIDSWFQKSVFKIVK